MAPSEKDRIKETCRINYPALAWSAVMSAYFASPRNRQMAKAVMTIANDPKYIDRIKEENEK